MTQTDTANVPAPPETFNFAQHLLGLNAARFFGFDIEWLRGNRLDV